MLRRRLGTMAAVATLATALGCGGGSDGPSGGTCDPTVHTTADPQGVADHCLALVGVFCARGFGDCSATLHLADFFSSVEECTSFFGSSCAQDNANSWYDAPCGEACIQYAQTASCSALETEPQACAAATGSLPIPCTATIGTGTISDTISVLEPLYEGGHARAYCIAFSAGQSVTIQTSAPTAGTPIVDTVLHLLAPSGAEIAQNDDDLPSLYSRISTTVPTSGTYQIVVRGWSSSDLGGYRLTVTTP